MKSFEPWIQRVETLRDEFLEEAARAVPVEWYEGGTAELVSLVATLGERRGLVRNLVQECVRSSANYFLNWEG
jgi:hemolysin-activating ACP:hemolysin acyltransferase